MKLIVTVLLAMCAAASAQAESFVVDRDFEAVARILQQRLPNLASDHRFEAKRTSAEWRYAFWITTEKTWAEEVRITVRQKAAHTSDVDVQVLRKEGGLVKQTTKPEPETTAEWTAKIREMLAI
jgi:thiamine kinase-like enzyme